MSSQLEITFAKYQGAGNDFVLVDGETCAVADLASRAAALCDRHFGIGADGLIVVSRTPGFDAAMQYFNADGSESVCGNGMRCVGRFLLDQKWVAPSAHKIQLKIATGAVTISVSGSELAVDMGTPIFEGLHIPVAEPGEHLEHELIVAGTAVRCSVVSMGNPHCVIFLERGQTEQFFHLGAELEVHPFFPQRTNVEFVEILSPKEVSVKVWERGVGKTLACGTGNCAVLATGVRLGYVQREIKINSDGGTFLARWDEELNKIFLQGPAKRVFTGTFLVD